MGYATVRAGIVAAMSSPALVTGLDAMFAAEPMDDQPVDPAPPPTQRTVAWAFVHLETTDETRISMPVGGGWKEVLVGAVLGVQTRTNTTLAHAMGDLDALIDALKVRLRSVPTLNGITFICAEGQPYSPTGHIMVQTSGPVRESGRGGNSLLTYSEIRFHLKEMVQV